MYRHVDRYNYRIDDCVRNLSKQIAPQRQILDTYENVIYEYIYIYIGAHDIH